MTTATAITSPTARLTFPRDADLRRELLPHSTHGAKMNLHLLGHILEHHIPRGSIVLDPMGGCGSTLYGITKDWHVQIIELEPKSVEQAVLNNQHLHQAWALRNAWIQQGNAADWQGFPPFELAANHIVFSPPYGNTAARERNNEPATAKRAAVPDWVKTRTDPSLHVDSYGTEFFQIGSMNYARHLSAMAIVYRNCYQALRDGGTMVVVTADFWRASKRVPLVRHTRQLCEEVGFICTDWWQRDRSHQMTAFQNVRRRQGLPLIEEEDVQVFRKAAR